MQLSSRILTALAVLILSVAVVAVRAGTSGTVDAATGTIDVLNVGTCYTTNSDAFAVGDCDDGDGNAADTTAEGYNVAGREVITEVATGTSVYATYAIDPKTSGDAPRAILTNSDLIQISIEDKGRDKRTGILYAVGTSGTPTPTNTEIAGDEQEDVINRVLGEDLYKELENASNVTVSTSTKEGNLNDASFVVREPGSTSTGTTTDTIDSSGIYRLNLIGTGNARHPMAPRGDGKIVWFGTVTKDGTAGPFQDLKNYISLDEDLSSGTRGALAPWMRVTASVPSVGTGANSVNIQFIYYQTSAREEIVGGKTKNDYTGKDGNPTDGASPVFVDDEVPSATNTKPDVLVLRAGADGVPPTQNLWLKETGDFTGVYEGYLRLTDANGDGSVDDDPDTTTKDETKPRDDWGLDVGPATGDVATNGNLTTDGAAVLGVESGPVTISYRNSNGDSRSATILIDKVPPAIQIDSPAHNTSSKDDSPDLLGSFTDGGGAGLRDNSFRIYADNTDDNDDARPVWDFGVHDVPDVDRRGTVTGANYGYVCVDADEEKPVPATASGCETAGIAALRGHYSGYSSARPTFGIINSEKVYLDTEADDDTDGAKDYKAQNSEDYEDGDDSGIFDTVVRIDFPTDEDDDNRYNNTIDIQAVVLDIAGNYGFSDSQASEPTFIHDYGTKIGKKPEDRDDYGVHNVLGWYSRHQYRLDDVDPKYAAKQSATGFFTDEDGDETASNSGLKIVFDGKIDEASVGVDTFVVKLDSGENATVTDVDVDGKNVYLMLEETLEPDATPQVDLATGASILDLAGNESTERRLDGIEVNDGILPTFTITLGGGSGLNEETDGEGASELTKNQMTISIESNEDIQGAPRFSVVCSDLTWGKLADENDVAAFAKNRKGTKTDADIDGAAPTASGHGGAAVIPDKDDPKVTPDVRTTCMPEDSDASPATARKYFDVATTSALARPGNKWEYLWANLTGDAKLEDGKLSVIVWGRDRSSYDNAAGVKLYNYSSATATFVYDTDLEAAWEGNDDADAEVGELVPDDGDDVFEPRPFVLLDFGDEKTTVNVTKFTIDKVDYTADLQILDDNEFVWWPEPLDPGKYAVYVEANDAADNKDDYTYSFTVKERSPFVLSLLAGWNSISFPSNPIDRALHAVFTDDAVDVVVGWDVTNPVSPWRSASKMDGVWTTNDDNGPLNDIEARYGYWVHSTSFVTQAVQLSGKGDRATDGQPSPADIPTETGWNFVGVVDVDGDQTQDDAGETLRNSNNDPITAAEYLGNYTRAYTWDHINNTWDVIKTDEGITIGTGVWVYYTKDHDIAP